MPDARPRAACTRSSSRASGFTGISDVIEAGYGGFLSSFSAKPDAQRLTADLGRVWETGKIGFKMYPNVTSIHSALDGFASIRSENSLGPDDIEGVEVQCPHMTFVHTAWPYKAGSVTAAQMNMFYGIAAMAVAGRVAAGEYAEDALADPRVTAFIPRIQVRESAELEAKGAEYRHASMVRVRAHGGQTFERLTLHRRGSPENPVTRADVVQKFRNNVRHLTDGAADRIIQLVDALDTADTFGELMDVLGTEHRPAGAM